MNKILNSHYDWMLLSCFRGRNETYTLLGRNSNLISCVYVRCYNVWVYLWQTLVATFRITKNIHPLLLMGTRTWLNDWWYSVLQSLSWSLSTISVSVLWCSRWPSCTIVVSLVNQVQNAGEVVFFCLWLSQTLNITVLTLFSSECSRGIKNPQKEYFSVSSPIIYDQTEQIRTDILLFSRLSTHAE